MNNDTTRPKNPSANTIPSKGYVLEIDGKFKSEFKTSGAAMKSALDLKKKCPQIQVDVYDTKEHVRTLVNSLRNELFQLVLSKAGTFRTRPRIDRFPSRIVLLTYEFGR